MERKSAANGTRFEHRASGPDQFFGFAECGESDGDRVHAGSRWRHVKRVDLHDCKSAPLAAHSFHHCVEFKFSGSWQWWTLGGSERVLAIQPRYSDWNGSPRTNTSQGFLAAQVNASDLTTPGYAEVTVVTPGGVVSNAAEFQILYQPTAVNQSTNDMVWDSLNQVFYISHSEFCDRKCQSDLRPASDNHCNHKLPGWE
jgi:hypothetical protein